MRISIVSKTLEVGLLTGIRFLGNHPWKMGMAIFSA